MYLLLVGNFYNFIGEDAEVASSYLALNIDNDEKIKTGGTTFDI